MISSSYIQRMIRLSYIWQVSRDLGQLAKKVGKLRRSQCYLSAGDILGQNQKSKRFYVIAGYEENLSHLGLPVNQLVTRVKSVRRSSHSAEIVIYYSELHVDTRDQVVRFLRNSERGHNSSELRRSARRISQG